jgi:hypothetical protein
MRKVTEQAVNAFMNNKAFRQGNTAVSIMNNEIALYLHAHKIARKDMTTNVVEINNCNWCSNTTKERLNGIISEVSGHGDCIYQSNWAWYWKDAEPFLDNRWHTLN